MGVLLASRGDMSDPVARRRAVRPAVALHPLHPRRGRRLDRQQRRRLLLLRAVPAVARPAAAALPGHRAGHRRLDGHGPLHPVRARTSRPCCTTSSRCSSSGSGPFARGVDDRRPDAPLALRPGRDPRRRPAGAYWGWHGINPRGWIALLAGRRRVPADHQRADPAGPVSDALGGADLTWTARAAGERGRLLGARAGTAGGQSRRSSSARATATARVSASSLR